MSEWQGKSKGTILGYKIFVWICQHLGIAPAYFVLQFVALYFFLFAPSSTSSIFKYYRKRLRFGIFKSLFNSYKTNYLLGQSIIDKMVTLAGLKTSFTFHFEGVENLNSIANNGKGGILMSAHAGNWELAGQYLNHLKTKINIVMFDGEHRSIKQYLHQLGKKNFHIITIKEDMSHVYEIGAALAKNELVCMHADRFLKGNKTLEMNFLGESAPFPAGPFLMSAGFNVPVSFVYAFKETNKHYHFFGSSLVEKKEGEQKKDFAQRLAKQYVQDLENKVRQYPEQWFNYYDFWKK